MGAQRPLLASRAERFLNYFLTSPVAQRVRKENLTYLTPLKMRRLEKAVSKALKDNVAGDVAEFGIALGDLQSYWPGMPGILVEGFTVSTSSE